MRINNKLRWLPEVIDDMIDFCEKNSLNNSRQSLLHVRTVMLEELCLEQHGEEPNNCNEPSSDSATPSDLDIFYFRNMK